MLILISWEPTPHRARFLKKPSQNKEGRMKKVMFTQRNQTPHWVGDGFPVRNMFSYQDIAAKISPFLLMDYAGPTEFPPFNSEPRRGVGSHPHRGFETVTIVYDGEVEHRDSAGGGGVIQKGDVQWMTAASGLVHEERHGRNFSKTGGRFEMIQLWVNLPKKDKMASPRYQGLKDAEIPKVELPAQAGTLRVIAGEYKASHGPAKTFSPVNLWDLQLSASANVELKVPAGHTAVVFVLSGQLDIGGTQVGTAELAVLDPDGDTLSLTAREETKLLFLGGEPLGEPIVGYGPFVMNTQAEILQAMQDFSAGKMGGL
jgi:redox-sensitive bicupin YhaK (pirin superfamily)